MNNRTAIYTVILVLLVFFTSCDIREHQDKQARKRPFNPNGDSELAILMRNMFDYSDSLKQLARDGKQLSGLRKYQNIHSAIPTDPDASGPVFEGFANAYIQSIKALEVSDSSTVFCFNQMVDQCMSCHTEFCPGPKKRIKQLYIR